MDTRTGQLTTYDKIELLSPEEQTHFIEVKRDLTAVEKLNKQIKKYSLCACGSGKKFKFCCYNSNK